MHQGDGEKFDENWEKTNEAYYTHFIKGPVQNQIQFAFRKHWETAVKMLQKPIKELKVLEVGCGRGSLSAYFADEGAECHVLDISPKAIKIAEESFAQHGFKADFYVSDCLNMPFLNPFYIIV